jgi:two-component system, NarL family, nitrate/nitrite response regulator NarL
MALRLLIVDDSALFLDAARTLLEREGVRVVAVASTGAEAVRHAREQRPDVTLVDVDLGDESGLDLAWHLADAAGAAGAAGHIVMISAYPEADLRDLVDASPAVGLVPKSQLSGRAIRQVIGEGEGGPGVSAGPGT